MRNALLTIILMVWCLSCSLGLDATQPKALSPGLAALAPEMLVVVGKRAPVTERQAAENVAAALRAADGPADNLLDDETALKNLDRTAFCHLILVGTYTSNELLHQQWGHFALDRAVFARERAVPWDTPRPTLYDGAPTTGFYVFGFGTFSDTKTGYLESGRNELYLVPIALDTPKKPPYRLRINVTGAGSAGVAQAAQALLTTGMLNGVIPAVGEKLPATGDAFLLGKDRYTRELPMWAPQEALLGWTLPDATDYAGFLQAGGKPAVHLWRAKYLTGKGITDFDTAPQRHSTAAELFIAQLASPVAAQEALAALVKTLSAKPQELKFIAVTLDGQPAQQAGDFYLAASGAWLLMESLPEPQGQQVLTAALKSLAQGGGK